MRKIALLLTTVAVAVTGCSRATGLGEDSAPAPRPLDEATERTADIYAAVIRRLVTKDHTFGAEPSPFERVFVVDGVVEEVGSPYMEFDDVRKPFPATVKRSIARSLRDLPPITFVANPASAIVNENSCAEVRDGGVLIRVGPISKARRGAVTVSNSLFIACLGGQWLTYVLEPADGSWRVTGTKGPALIS
jgi:hypothetical protein